MSGVILAGRRERQQTAARPGNGNERGVENRNAKNENRNKPRQGQMRNRQIRSRTQLQAERGHQEAQKHRAAVAHEDFSGIEIPDKKSQRGAKGRSPKSADERLAVEARRQSKKFGGYWGEGRAPTDERVAG